MNLDHFPSPPPPLSWHLMNATEVLGFILALLMPGVVGAVLPGLPGTPIIFLAALGHRLWFKDQSAAWWVVAVLGLLAVLSMAMDFLATTYGAKRLGATWRGMVGAVLGAMIGLFVLPPFGLILLPLVGAALGEILGRTRNGRPPARRVWAPRTESSSAPWAGWGAASPWSPLWLGFNLPLGGSWLLSPTA
ncbi:MAG: DUF456 domain-containing protein [Verrucomicrobiae bacterium]|nr:DUF456 domain-containing protein [Verrucomicrobiae bacterium]